MNVRSKIILGLPVCAGFLLRLRAVPPELADVDGVNFARALAGFDPLHQAPHLPGYPVYVAAAKPFATLGFSEVWSLALPALILFPFGALLLYLGVKKRFGDAHAFGALLFTSLAPPAVLSGAWPTSDGFGFALLSAAIGVLLLNGTLAAGILFGLLLGARLSWWPLLVSAFLLAPDRRRFALGGAAAIAAWTVGLFAFASPEALFEGVLVFARGHFTEWGLNPGLGFGARAILALAALAIAPLLPRELAIALVPYAIWILLAQNLEKARHFLPLIPIAGIALARARAAVAPISAALFVASAFLAVKQGTELAPAAALAHQLRARSPERLQVFAGESASVIRHVAPAVRVWRPASAEVLRREAALAEARGAEVIIAFDAPGAEELHARN